MGARVALWNSEMLTLTLPAGSVQGSGGLHSDRSGLGDAGPLYPP